MCRTIVLISLTLSALAVCSCLAEATQNINSGIVSEHVRMSMPFERSWLGRDVVMDIERCWQFMNRATGESLPKRIVVIVDWDGETSSSNAREGSITIGLNQPVAGDDVRGFLLRETAREMARIGLLNYAREGSPHAQTSFLFQGMSELLGREFNHSTRGLNSTWIIAQLLDRMKLLGVAEQSPWETFSGGQNDLRAAAPGLTFLMTCRELYGRDKTVKLFEGLRRGGLEESISATYRTSLRVLEEAWLKKVREYPKWSDVIITADEDAPVLDKAEFPKTLHPGESVRFRLFLRDKNRDLLPSGVYLIQHDTGAVSPATPGPASTGYQTIELRIENDRRPGTYGYTLTAIDEAGNVRNWEGSYSVEP
jgi:hypothetical protein